MIQIIIDNNDYADKNGKYDVTSFISDSMLDSWGSGGALETVESEVTNIRELLGRLVAELAKNEKLSARQVIYLARGFRDSGHSTFVNN